MQIVIDIPEETYHQIQIYGLWLCPRDEQALKAALKTGIVLPEKQGRDRRGTDNPRGNGKRGRGMNYLELYDQAMCDLDHDRISLGEFEKRIKPLKEEVRPTGHWEIISGNNSRCSICGVYNPPDYFNRPVIYNYCPFCGAKMEG